MKFLLVVPMVALVTGAVMLWLAIADIRGDWNKPHWRIRQSFDVLALSIGFVCVILTALHALMGRTF